MAGEEQQQGFDYIEDVRDLAMQAEALVPTDIGPADKQYVVQTIYNFCSVACEAIVKEENITPETAKLVTQFIGEWTFHKSLDLIRAGIDQQLRDVVLQKIAFVVFEIAKQAISKNMPQDQLVQVVEHHVKKAYLEALTELKDRGNISPDDFDAAMSQSNIDQMASSDEEQTMEEQDAQLEQEYPGAKLPKLATFAMILKKLPPEKADSMINKFPPDEADILRQYLALDNIEQMIDANAVKEFLKELKTSVPNLVPKKEEKPKQKIATIVTKKNERKINAIILKEREYIKEYVKAIREKQEPQLNSRISGIVNSYLAEKIKK